MVAAEIVSMDDQDKYYIHEEGKKALHPFHYAGIVPLMGEISEKVKECFREEGPRGIYIKKNNSAANFNNAEYY